MFDRDSHFVQTDRHSVVPSRVRAICASTHATDYGALIKEQDAFVDSVKRRHAAASAWLGLSCRRALLFAMGSPGREGAMMPVGTSWVSAAVDESIEALTLEPANERAAELLSAIAFEVIPDRKPAASEREALGDRHWVDVPPAIVPRLASLIYRAVQLGVRDPDVLRACTSLMFDAGDAATGHDCSMRALALGLDSTWHLLRLTWLAVLHNDTTSAKQLFTAALRAAHDSTARAELGWHLEDPCQPQHGCGPVGLLGTDVAIEDKVQWLTIPDLAVVRWLADHLAVVARGDTTCLWRGQCGFRNGPIPVLRGSQDWSGVVRHLVGHFTNVSYAASTFRGCWFTVNPQVSCWAVLDPYDDVPIDVIAQVDHLWDPATGNPVDLLPYTIVGNDLATRDSAGERKALVDLGFRRWGNAGARDTTLRLSLALPPHTPNHPTFTGYLVVPTVPGLDAWSLMATQTELRHGGVYQDNKPPLDGGPLALSDIVLGMATQGLAWQTGGHRIVLAPQGVVVRSEPVQLYCQVKSDIDRAGARTRITLFPEGADRTTAVPAMQIGFATTLHRGVNEIDRELVLSRLASGRYWFDVEVTDSAAHVTSHRSVLMYLK